MLRRLRIQARLWLAFGVILAMTAVLVAVGGFGLRVSQQAIEGITQKLIPTSNITVAARSHLLQSRAATATVVFSNLRRGYAGFLGPTAKIETSDQTSDAFLTESMYTKFVDWFDGKPAIPEATAILAGVLPVVSKAHREQALAAGAARRLAALFSFKIFCLKFALAPIGTFAGWFFIKNG